MYQVAFDIAVFAGLVPWLALHRQGLSVLVHPNTLAPRADHLEHALWLGAPLALRPEVLPESIDHGLRRAAFNAHPGGRGPPAVETRESAISTSPRIS